MKSANDALQPLGPDTAAQFGWTAVAPARPVMAALEAARAGSARFVGGCVRDSLMGARPKDIDIATTLTPDEVIAALRAARLGWARTGAEHGTITAIADHVGVEVTTLRADVSTDGRRATVAFTDDWTLDARRRDFTINAIYLTAKHELFDPAGGLGDIAARRVRYIGEAQDRIREDYLRILRFFRFSARFSDSFDPAGLAAARALKAGIRRLSAERVGDEMIKILDHESAARALEAMSDCGALAEVWPHEPRLAALAALKKAEPFAPAILCLAVLWPEKQASDGVDAALRLSNAMARRRRLALTGAAEVSADMSERAARAALYRLGVETWRDAVAVAAALAGGEDARWKALRVLPERWPPPVFPYTGKEVLALGVEPGPRVAKILRAVEAAWIDEDFPDTERLGALLRQAAG